MKTLSLAFLFAVSVLPAFSDTETVNGLSWTYTVLNGEASVGCDGQFEAAIPTATIGPVSIPATLGGYTVTKLGEHAFYKCDGITSVTIPNGVVSIGPGAFYNCSNLTCVTIPNSVATIGDNAFYNCSELTSVTIPNGLTNIGGSVFRNCSKLTLCTIPNSITNIGWSAFAGCNEISALTIEGTVSFFVDSFPDTLQQLTFMGDAPLLKCRVNKTIAIEPLKSSTGQIIGPDTATITVTESYSGMMSTYLPNCSVFVKPGSTGWRTTIPGWWRELPIQYLDGMGSADGQGGFDDDSGTYIVKFVANGGKLPTGKKMSAQKIPVGKATKLRKNVFVRKGWIFIGWSKTKTGAVACKNAQSVKNLALSGKTVTLYAQWAKKSYNISFYAIGGTGKMTNQKMIYGESAKLKANKFTKKGYRFVGWAKSKKLAMKGKVTYKNKKKVKNLTKNGKTVKLYAVWKKKPK